MSEIHRHRVIQTFWIMHLQLLKRRWVKMGSVQRHNIFEVEGSFYENLWVLVFSGAHLRHTFYNARLLKWKSEFWGTIFSAAVALFCCCGAGKTVFNGELPWLATKMSWPPPFFFTDNISATISHEATMLASVSFQPLRWNEPLWVEEVWCKYYIHIFSRFFVKYWNLWTKLTKYTVH